MGHSPENQSHRRTSILEDKPSDSLEATRPIAQSGDTPQLEGEPNLFEIRRAFFTALEKAIEKNGGISFESIEALSSALVDSEYFIDKGEESIFSAQTFIFERPMVEIAGERGTLTIRVRCTETLRTWALVGIDHKSALAHVLEGV